MSAKSSTAVPENMKSRLKDSYDAIAPAYNAWTQQQYGLRLVYLDKLLGYLTAGNTGTDSAKDGKNTLEVLELGCGAGIPVTEKLIMHPSPNIHVTANDMSTTQIALGKERLGTERVTWRECDMMALDFPAGSLDAVIGLYSLIHLPREEQGVLVGRITGWLRPGGLALLNFSAEAMEAAVIERWLAEEGWMYWSGWGAERTTEIIKEAGLEVLVGEVSKDEVDASFLWIIARRPSAG